MFPSFNARALGLDLSARETLRLAATNGFGGVDLMVRDALEQGEDLDELRRRREDLGLRAGASPFPFDWRGPEARFRDDLAGLPNFAGAAATLGIERTGTWVLPECPVGWDRETTTQWHVERLGPIAATLAGFGIRLGLEVIGVETSRAGRNEPFIARMDRLRPMIEEIESRSGVPVGLIADSWHLLAAGEPAEHALFLGASRVVWVHVADLPAGETLDRPTMVDAVRGLPGEGQTPETRDLLAILARSAYDGPVTAEPLGRCRSLAGLAPDAVATRAAGSLRAVWPSRPG